MSDIAFFFVGLATGGLGTLIGAGGGFLLAPLFLFLFPTMQPAHLTALSLLAVSANSLSGSVGYIVRRRVHWPSVILFSVCALPGVYLGVRLTHILPRNAFEIAFATFLFALGIFIFWRSYSKEVEHHSISEVWNKRAKLLGGGISFFVGVLSSLLGIGGGIVHVPLLSEVLYYPVHIAAGTSHAILAITSAVAVFEHLQAGDYRNLESFVPYLVVGLVIGAQVGASFSKKVSSKMILRALALALIAVAFRLALKNFT